MKKIFITGVNGQSGFYLSKYFSNKYHILGCGKDNSPYNDKIEYFKCDIVDIQNIKELTYSIKPDIIINTAALSNVDICEKNKDLSYKINFLGIKNIVDLIKNTKTLLIQLSTDYIFDGKKGNYSEEDKTNPINYYGKTKLIAEEYIKSELENFLIIRLSVLYSYFSYKQNFFYWTYNKLKQNKEINIVTDLINTPTYIYNLYKGIKLLISKEVKGIYNISNKEKLTRYDFALRVANFFGFNRNLVKKTSVSEIKFTAPRPLDTSLSIAKIESLGYVPLTIEETFNHIKKNSE